MAKKKTRVKKTTTRRKVHKTAARAVHKALKQPPRGANESHAKFLRRLEAARSSADAGDEDEEGEAAGGARAGRIVEKVEHDYMRGLTYQLERVFCGKEKCKCARGVGHGPYWYAYFRSGPAFRQKSVYLGKIRDDDKAKKRLRRAGKRI